LAESFQVSEAHPASVAASALAVMRIFAPGTREGRLGVDDLAIMYLLPAQAFAGNGVGSPPA
jgi:hypothetical protein